MSKTALSWLLLVAGVGLLGSARANAANADPCSNLPPAVSAYLGAKPQWVLVRVTNLNADDRKLWKDAHGAKCPGLAIADFEGRGRLSYGLALLRHDRRGDEEKFVILHQRAKGISIMVVFPPYRPGNPDVVWRAPPGRTQAWDDDTKTILVPHDSVIFETLEAAAQQFYFKNDHLLKIQTSD